MRFLRWFLRLFFMHFYTTLAWSYDLVAWTVSVGQWNTWVQSVLQPFPSQPILEIAHGPGHLLEEINRQGGRVFGVDASRQMCQMASRRLKRAGFDARLVQARAQNLPFPRETFPTLLSTFPTEFILDPASLIEVRRTLEPDGEYRVVAMAEITGAGVLDRVAAWLFRITGQTAEIPPAWTEPISEAGLEISRDDVELERSKVVRYFATIAEKVQVQDV